MINILGVISTILRLIRRRIYRSQIRKVAKEVGENLKVNFKSRVNRNTILGNNVSFNGVKIRGDGEVVIGDNCIIESNVYIHEGSRIGKYNIIQS